LQKVYRNDADKIRKVSSWFGYFCLFHSIIEEYSTNTKEYAKYGGILDNLVRKLYCGPKTHRQAKQALMNEWWC
jgi:hypothetical protein